MGRDVVGFLELYHPEFKRWVAFKEINDEQDYSWFSILSGGRGACPKIESIEDGPDVDMRSTDRREIVRSGRAVDDERFSRAWVECCKQWGPDLHSHTVVPYREIMAANVRKWEMDKEYNCYSDIAQEAEDDPPDIETTSMSYHQEVPSPDFIVEEIIFDTQWNADRRRQELMQLPMNLPLREIVGTDDLSEVVRMVVAYRN